MFRISSILFFVLIASIAIIEATETEDVRRDDAHRSYRMRSTGADEQEQPTATRIRSKSNYWKLKVTKERPYLFGSRDPPPGSRISLNNYAFFSKWRDFKRAHNKSYDSSEEEAARFHIYVENHQKIEEHNQEYEAGRKPYKMEMNRFGDLTPAEFRRYNGFKRELADNVNSAPRGSTFLVPSNINVPSSMDWRTKGYVTHVKNQGQCGSCWAFSAVGALEGQHFRKTGKMIELSEQNLVDCSGPYGNQGCNGGLMDNAFNYVKANPGIDTENSYPYEAKDDRCRFKKENIGAEDTGYTDIPAGNETALVAALATVGPVSVAIDAGHESFQFYSKGVYYEPECSSEQLDHGVLAVGYGATEKGEKYYIVKNSWGEGWGQKGYILMARDRDNHCGIASAASYPLV